MSPLNFKQKNLSSNGILVCILRKYFDGYFADRFISVQGRRKKCQ